MLVIASQKYKEQPNGGSITTLLWIQTVTNYLLAQQNSPLYAEWRTPSETVTFKFLDSI